MINDNILIIPVTSTQCKI